VNKLSQGQELMAGLSISESGYLYLGSSDGRILKISGKNVPVYGPGAMGNKLIKVAEGSRVSCAVWDDRGE